MLTDEQTNGPSISQITFYKTRALLWRFGVEGNNKTIYLPLHVMCCSPCVLPDWNQILYSLEKISYVPSINFSREHPVVLSIILK